MVIFSIAILVDDKWRGKRWCYFWYVLKRNSPGDQRSHCGGMGENTKIKYVYQDLRSLQEILSAFSKDFFPTYTKLFSTLSFSQELTDRHRKAQWISILELPSEAKGEVWGQTGTRAWGVPDLTLNEGTSTSTSEGIQGWNRGRVCQNARMELHTENYLGSVAIHKHKKPQKERQRLWTGLTSRPGNLTLK